MTPHICDCENTNCRAPHALARAACPEEGTVKTLYSRVCPSCAAFLDAQYLAERFSARQYRACEYAIWDNVTGTFDLELGTFPDFIFTQELADELNRKELSK